MSEKNRKQRKMRYIRARNRVLRDAECGNGLYWCNHIFDPERPWVWVDFIFLSERHKGRYFAVAMTTCEYAALGDAEELAWDEVDKQLPNPSDLRMVKAEVHSSYGQLWRIVQTEEEKTLSDQRYELFKKLQREYSSHPVKIKPSIEVRLEYGPVAVGLWVRVNKPFIDDSVIREFITDFRDLGEPLKQGIVWEGEEIEVVPARLNEQ